MHNLKRGKGEGRTERGSGNAIAATREENANPERTERNERTDDVGRCACVVGSLSSVVDRSIRYAAHVRNAERRAMQAPEPGGGRGRTNPPPTELTLLKLRLAENPDALTHPPCMRNFGLRNSPLHTCCTTVVEMLLTKSRCCTQVADCWIASFLAIGIVGGHGSDAGSLEPRLRDGP